MAYIYYNPNPVGRSVDDCAVRAIAKALSVSWDDAHEMLCYNARMMGDMPHAESVWGSVLRQHGFYRTTLPNLLNTWVNTMHAQKAMSTAHTTRIALVSHLSLSTGLPFLNA